MSAGRSRKRHIVLTVYSPGGVIETDTMLSEANLLNAMTMNSSR